MRRVRSTWDGFCGRYWSIFTTVRTEPSSPIVISSGMGTATKATTPPAAIVRHGAASVNIIAVAAKTAAAGVAYKFRLPGQRPVVRTDLAQAKLEAKKALQLVTQGAADATSVTVADLSELAALGAWRRKTVPSVADEEWRAAKLLAGPALLTVAQEHAAAIADGKHERVQHAEAWKRFIAAKNLGNDCKATRTYTSKGKAITAGLGAGVMIDTLRRSKSKYGQTGSLTQRREMSSLSVRNAAALVPGAGTLPGRQGDTNRQCCALERGHKGAWHHQRETAKVVPGLYPHAPHPPAGPHALCSLSPLRSDEVHGKREINVIKDGKIKRLKKRDRCCASAGLTFTLDQEGHEDHYRVTVAKEGTPEDRLVPINPALKAWLALCPRNGEFVCDAGAMERVREILRKRRSISVSTKSKWRSRARRSC